MGRPMPDRIQQWGIQIGLVFMMGLFVFVEPDASDRVISNVLKVFPEKIISDTSAGVKATKVKKKTDTNDKSKKKDKANRKKKSITDEIDEIINSPKSKGHEDMNEPVKDRDNNDLIGTEIEKSRELKERPGISYQRDQNLLDPFVTGIAVRP